MNGAQSLAQTLVNCGVEVCFANPGHFGDALRRRPRFEPAPARRALPVRGRRHRRRRRLWPHRRQAGRDPAASAAPASPTASPTCTTRAGRRRRSSTSSATMRPTIVRYDAPLTTDIIGLARPVSAWVRRSRNASSVAGDAARAVQAARAAPGGVATLIVPADCAWSPAERAAEPLPDIAPAVVPAEAIESVARLLANGKRSAMLLRGPALRRRGAGGGGPHPGQDRRAAAVRHFRPPHPARAPAASSSSACLISASRSSRSSTALEQLVLVGAEAPVSFFAYPGKPGYCAPEGCEIVYLAHADEDGARAVDRSRRRARRAREACSRGPRPPRPADRRARRLRRRADHRPSDARQRHRGGRGADRQPGAAGGASRTRGRTTICRSPAARSARDCRSPSARRSPRPIARSSALKADGSGAYTMQALWTMARERLDATVVVFANRSYAILNIEAEARRGDARRQGAGAARSAQSGAELGADRRGHGRRSEPRYDRGRLRGAIPLGDGRPRPAPYRSVDLRPAAALSPCGGKR